MRGAYSVVRAARAAAMPRAHVRYASTLLRMPAMSPTMTEGGIAQWKVSEGDAYVAGDVILEVETDKATIDVEAQDDGVMGKIIFPSGSKNVPVGEAIAVLAEEGDDLSKIEVPSDLSPEKTAIPKEDTPAAPAAPAAPKEPAPAAKSEHYDFDHSKPMLPSVAALLHQTRLPQDKLDKIKPTGKNGLLTRGDVLAALGKIDNPYGSAKKLLTEKPAEKASAPAPGAAPAAPKAEPPLDGPALRRLIVQGLTKAAAPVAPKDAPASTVSDAEFDDLLADYAPLLPSKPAPAPAAAPKDDLAGLI